MTDSTNHTNREDLREQIDDLMHLYKQTENDEVRDNAINRMLSLIQSQLEACAKLAAAVAIEETINTLFEQDAFAENYTVKKLLSTVRAQAKLYSTNNSLEEK